MSVDRAALAGPTLGTVDLVAIERVRSGEHAELTDADRAYLFAHITGEINETSLVARALDMDERQVLRLRERARAARTGVAT